MKIVYLDQNKWIELSREAHGLDPSHRHVGVLSAVREAAEQGVACFPLSMGHYKETYAHSDPARRLRLASFMLSVSRNETLAPIEAIVEGEIEEALSRAFPGRVSVRALRLLGRGLEHTCAYPLPRLVARARDDDADVEPGRDRCVTTPGG